MSIISAITIATTLRFMIGVQIGILGASVGLQIVEYGINTLSEISAIVRSIFMISVFATLLCMLADHIAQKAGTKSYQSAKSGNDKKDKSASIEDLVSAKK